PVTPTYTLSLHDALPISFVRQLTGVRIGLIPFAGDAFLWCPLTYDTETFLDTLRSVDVDIIPSGGTNLLSAVDTAERSFLGQAGDRKSTRLNSSHVKISY